MADARGPPRTKNKAAAPQQITAEMLMQEAASHSEQKIDAPTTRGLDLEEVQEFRQRKRTEFENFVRRSPHLLKNWTQYAEFEVSQSEWARARSIFERAMDKGHQHSVPLWMRYVDSELKGRNISHARNLLDRLTTIMPRLDKGWYKYVYVEQLLGDFAAVRSVFDRWLSWQPDEHAFLAAIKFEQKYNELDRAREIWDRLLSVHPEPQQHIRRGRWEEQFGTTETARQIYGDGVDTLGDEFVSEELLIAWARFEAKVGEPERAAAIMRTGLDGLPRSKTKKLQAAYTRFEKQHGDKQSIEDVVLARRRAHYAEELKENPKSIDLWIDLCRLEETSKDDDRIIDTYEQAFAKALPPTHEKRHWRRWVYIGLFYATWTEDSKDATRARQIYETLLKLVPHAKFTFAKLWTAYATFEVRQGNTKAAFRIYGTALGKCPKPKIYKDYIALCLKLFDFPRARTLYEKFIEYDPINSSTWIKWVELERGLDDTDRARSILKLGLEQDELDMPESVWKAAIDFETDEGEIDRARVLYEQLLERTDHVKVWISYAQFEINAELDDSDSDSEEDENSDDETQQQVSPEAKARARKVFERGFGVMKDKDLADERVALLNAWKGFETQQGDAASLARVEKMMPRRVKKRRKVAEGEFEEYLSWVFPDDEAVNPKALNMMQMAAAWRAKAANGGGDADGKDDGEGSGSDPGSDGESMDED